MTSTTQTVREIALEQPHSIRVFERFGIDYCCGGRKPLAEACVEKQIAVGEVLEALEAAGTSASPLPMDWSKAKLASLIDHIVATHHVYVKVELPGMKREDIDVSLHEGSLSISRSCDPPSCQEAVLSSSGGMRR